ncbi:MAG: aspartate carbamoyltransferase [Tissierellia bacterium]|nr:aspartate carbamoyltransferase [Tissierellia bacterium]
MLRHFLVPGDLSREEYRTLLRLAETLAADEAQFRDILRGRVLASLFFEPSTRTRLSFEAAMARLGGTTIHLGAQEVSSLAKGESLEDTIRILEGYSDLAVIRSREEYLPQHLSEVVENLPVINAGDGTHAHPTQTLADILTIHQAHGKFSGLHIGLCGDLKFGRTVYSLLEFMDVEENRYSFIAPEDLQVPEEFASKLHNPHQCRGSLEEVIGDLDVLYMTRVQRERFGAGEEHHSPFVLNGKILEGAKENLAILHPLPRVHEIAVDVDEDPRALYFRQAKNGMIMRMALILFLLNEKEGGIL